jgi:PPOX class probable F420-dependent enzyme
MDASSRFLALRRGRPTTRKQDFSSLRGHKYCLLSTFRQNGEAVPTPVWFGLAYGKVYIRTEAGVGKVKAHTT